MWCLSPLFCRVCHCPWAVESPAWGSSLHHWLSGEGGWAHVRDDLRFRWGCTSQTSQQAAKATICIALIYPDWRLTWCPSFGSTGDSEVRLETTVEANYIKKKKKSWSTQVLSCFLCLPVQFWDEKLCSADKHAGSFAHVTGGTGDNGATVLQHTLLSWDSYLLFFGKVCLRLSVKTGVLCFKIDVLVTIPAFTCAW